MYCAGVPGAQWAATDPSNDADRAIAEENRGRYPASTHQNFAHQCKIQIQSNSEYKYLPMQNTNTKMQNTNTKQLRVPNHKADRQNTNRNIAKDSEGCPVSLSVSQVNFINVMIWVSQFVKICHE